MLQATASDLVLSSTSIIDDVQDHDDISGLRLSYTYKGVFITVLVSIQIPANGPGWSTAGPSNGVIPNLIARFNQACTWTDQDRNLGDVDKRLDVLWHEADELVKAVVVPEVANILEKIRGSGSTNQGSAYRPGSLHDYISPMAINLQIIPSSGNFGVIQRQDLPVSLPFVVEKDVTLASGIEVACAKDIIVLQSYRAHVLKVQIKSDIFCCKLSQTGAQNSFLREFAILCQLHSSDVAGFVRIPRLRSVVSVKTGIIGFLTDWIDTEQPDMIALLQSRTALPVATRHKWVGQIRQTLESLHGLNLVWGDAKSANILIDKHQNAWLTDFGGGFTRGYVDEALYDSKAGDLQGFQNILLDIYRE